MRWLRGLGRLLGGCLLAVLLVPSLAAWPSALLDRGPGGAIRLSLFPMALVAFDPFVWTCARNSLLVASATAGGSLVLGVGLGWIVGRKTFWGRSSLWFLCLAPLAVGPLLIAPAIAWALGGQQGWDWLAARSIIGLPVESLVRWAALVWTGVASGTPLVAMATLAGLRRVETCWIDSALAVGASGRRAWWDVTWPLLRPGVARASAMVFTLALIEPAGPLVFGLGRTLAAQIVQSAGRLDQPTHLSTLALLAIAIALVGRSILGWWGGTIHPRPDRPMAGVTPRAGFRQASISLLTLAVWCGATLGTVALWSWRVLRDAPDSGSSHGRWPLLVGLNDPEIRSWFANSALSAGLALALNLTILRVLVPRGPGRDFRVVDLSGRFLEAIPPLALGAGALAIPWMLMALADFAGEPSVPWCRWLATGLSPGRSPGFLLIVVLAAGQWPVLAGEAGRARGQFSHGRADAARIMGESDRRAYRAGEKGWLGAIPVSSAFLAFALASTSLAPALLLSPFDERRTVAAGLLGFLLEPGRLDHRAVGPIAVLLGLNLLALILTTRKQLGTARDGSRRE